MTIAIGMLCAGGIIVAADRMATLTDGSTKEDHKVCIFDGKTIAFAIADASDDANAARSLVNNIASSLAISNTRKLRDIEALISGMMTKWYKPFKEAPVTKLIVGVVLKGCGAQLYLCQPPNTVLPQPDGYVAAGIGSSVTDPLAATLFHPVPSAFSAATVLRHLSYLMYRAKKGNAFCGGGTDAVYLDASNERAEWVYSDDLKIAEEASFQLDIILNMATTVVLNSPGELLGRDTDAIGGLIVQCEKLRNTTFRNVRGVNIL